MSLSNPSLQGSGVCAEEEVEEAEVVDDSKETASFQIPQGWYLYKLTGTVTVRTESTVSNQTELSNYLQHKEAIYNWIDNCWKNENQFSSGV